MTVDTPRPNDEDLARADSLGRWIHDTLRAAAGIRHGAFWLTWSVAGWDVPGHDLTAHQAMVETALLADRTALPWARVPPPFKQIAVHWVETTVSNAGRPFVTLTVSDAQRSQGVRNKTIRDLLRVSLAPAFMLERLGCPQPRTSETAETSWSAKVRGTTGKPSFLQATFLGNGATPEQALADAMLRAGLWRTVLGHDAVESSIRLCDLECDDGHNENPRRYCEIGAPGFGWLVR